MKWIAIPLGVLVFAQQCAAEEALLGAAAVIEELSKEQSGPPPNPFEAALKELQNGGGSLSPKEAGAKWVKLLSEWTEGSARNRDFTDMVIAIPGPGSWQDIEKEIGALKDVDPFVSSLYEIFTATLANDEKARWAAFERFLEIQSKKPKTSGILQKLLSFGDGGLAEFQGFVNASLAEAIAKTSNDPEITLAALRVQIENRPPSNEGVAIQVPDLVSLAGEEKAKDFLLKAMQEGATLNTLSSATKALAQQVALDNIKTIKAPQWELVSGIGEVDIKLFEAMSAKFPGNAPEWSAKETAAGYYLAALIAANRVKDAEKLLGEGKSDMDRSAVNLLVASGYGDRLFMLLDKVLHESPTLTYWPTYLKLAADNKKTAEALELAKSALETKGLNKETKERLESAVTSAYLAHGSTEEALAFFRKQIADSKDSNAAFNIAVKMAKIGRLLGMKPVTDEGIEKAILLSASLPGRLWQMRELTEILIAEKRLKEAEAFTIQNISAQLADPRMGGSEINAALCDLAEIYTASGKESDVLYLLEHAPWWGTGNLYDIVEMASCTGTPIGVLAAKALQSAERTGDAISLLQSLLLKKPNSDKGYALLVEIQGAEAMSFLDRQIEIDRFEERPLIWKAELLLRAGKPEEAEKIIRAGIQIDPSDGEMGAGDRMRAYDVLARVLDAQGKTEDAKIYHQAVAAIRIAEKADKLRNAGLLSQAIALYEEALTHFADAYCIQSRLAIQYAELGDMQKAQEHYRRAFELMPDSFGRIESHCFGCEHVFQSPEAESIASETFTKMLEKDPKKPQLHYLLGYLRSEQGRYDEALACFEKAVELDPDYVNAWKKIAGLASQSNLGTAKRDRAILALVRLDPYSRHGTHDLEEVADVALMWNTVEEIRRKFPPSDPKNVFPLPASQGADPRALSSRYLSRSNMSALPKPGELLSRQVVIESVGRLIENVRNF